MEKLKGLSDKELYETAIKAVGILTERKADNLMESKVFGDKYASLLNEVNSLKAMHKQLILFGY